MKARAGLPGLVCVAALLLVGCGKSHRSQPAAPLPTATVRVQPAENKRHIATEDVVGTVRAKLRSVIEAKVSGRIEQMLVAPGQVVKAGDLLAQLDAREIQDRLDQARPVFQQAESDLKRYTTLFENKTVSQSEFDTAQSRFRVTQAALNEAETTLSYTKIKAPFDGVITHKYADVGDLAAPGKPLLGIEDSRSLRLEGDVPEALISKIKLGDRLAVRLAAADSELEGVVSEISPAADPNSRTFLVKLDLPTSPSLRAGQFGRVAIPVGETRALRVPSSAIVRRGQMELVFVAANGHAQLRLIKTGKRMGEEVELVSGLEAGEQVVVDGAAGLIDGQPIAIKP